MCSPCFNVLKGFCCSKPPPPPPQPSYESLLHSTQPLLGAILLLVIAYGIVATGRLSKLWLRSARIGDLANAFVLVNTGGFLAVVLANNAGLIDWLSPSFSREGASRALSNTQLSNRKASNVNGYTLSSPACMTYPVHDYTLTSPGFCVFGHDLQLLDLPLLQSHILCFYVDTLTALVLAWLARKHQGVTHPS